MSIDDVRRRNVSNVELFYQSERDRDISAWVDLWHPDGRQTFPTLGPEFSVNGIVDLKAVTSEKFRVRPPYVIEAKVEPFADPSQVLAKLDLDFPGRPRAHIWCLFHFSDDGLVVEVEELFDRGSLA